MTRPRRIVNVRRAHPAAAGRSRPACTSARQEFPTPNQHTMVRRNRILALGAKSGNGPEASLGAERSDRQDARAETSVVGAAVAAPRQQGAPGGELNASIVRAAVRVHRSHVGRGPTKARAFFRDNIVVVVLEDVLTQIERSLVASGRHDTVIRGREALLETMSADLIAAIETLTDRRVTAFMSATHLEPDMAGEIFVLDRRVESGSAHDGRVEHVASPRRAALD